MTHEKRLLLALILSIIVCFWWAHLMTEKQRSLQKAAKKKEDTSSKSPSQTTPPPQQVITEKKQEEKQEDAKKLLKERQAEEPVYYENDIYSVTWSNWGATLKWAKFKKFWHDYTNKKAASWEKNPDHWLTIIPDVSSQLHSLAVFESGMELDQRPWKLVTTPAQTPDQLVFELTPNNEITYRKKITFHADKHMISGELTLINSSDKEKKTTLQLGGGAGILWESSDDDTSIVGYAMYPNDKGYPLYETFDYKKLIQKKAKLDRNIAWVALSNRYFAHVLEVEKPELIAGLAVEAFDIEDTAGSWMEKTIDIYKRLGESSKVSALKKKPKQVMMLLNTKELSIPAKTGDKPGEITIKFDFYIDSKERLAQKKLSFKELDDYGFFGGVSQFLLWILNLFYRLFQNYGIAIICLTLTIKIVLYPLSRKQQISMQNYQKKMGKFQPELKKLQEKYKNNKQKLQEEMLKLYKDHGINPIPLGGCLPIFLQLPIFIGLYSALAYSIQLRQASFLWITDLAQPDRIWRISGFDLNILPIVMTIIWFIQMKTAPQPEDPQLQQQQKIMTWMPFIFGIMFYGFASGLVLYWLIMQLVTIVEQAWIKKSHA